MSNTALLKEIDILLVEDNEVDAEAVERAFKKANLSNPLHNASDGVEALQMLKGQNGKMKLPQPCILLLDINMPRMDGIELLKQLRESEDESLQQSVVFMLTTSNRSGDRVLAYERNIAGYCLKENLNEFIKMLASYCTVNEFTDYDEIFRGPGNLN